MKIEICYAGKINTTFDDIIPALVFCETYTKRKKGGIDVWVEGKLYKSYVELPSGEYKIDTYEEALINV